MNEITIEIRNVYGEAKAYPIDHGAQCIARIAGTKTLTKATMLNVLAMGIKIIEVDRHGRPCAEYKAGRVNLPMVA